jgi:ParB-like chromosome segregation protein Spo0J
MTTLFASLKVAAENKDFQGVSKITNFNVDPRLIEVEPGFNRPISRDVVEGFKTTMRQGKKIPALMVRVEENKIILVDGEHRVIAAMELIAEGVQILSMSAEQFRGNDVERIMYKLASANENGVSPLNQGIDYVKLRNMGLTNQMIRDGVGKTVAHITTCIELAEANHDVHTAINNGDISSTEARKVVKEHGSKAGEVIAAAKATSGKKKVTAKVLKPSREKVVKSKWPDWMHVEDGLPQERKYMLCQCTDDVICIGEFIGSEWQDQENSLLHVVYWMELPPPAFK